MSRPTDSGRVNLNQVFMHMQSRMMAHLDVGKALEHASTCGAASEVHWLKLLNSHLPERYRASSAFIVDWEGNRSRQIDIAIYDRFYSPLIFPYESGFLIPAESVYAIIEVKQLLTRSYLFDAGTKIASVRRLNRTSVRVPYAGGSYPPKKPHRILGAVAATRSVWGNDTFRRNLVSVLDDLGAGAKLDLGCVVSQGAFEVHHKTGGKWRKGDLEITQASESLICFMIRLIERLREMGNAPAVDLMSYGSSLQSFKKN